MGAVAGILLLLLLLGMIGLGLAVSSYFRYKEWHDKKDSIATVIGIVMMLPSLYFGYIFIMDWLTNNVGNGLRILLLIICAVLGLGLFIWSFIRYKKSGSGGLGMLFGGLIVMWACYNAILPIIL